MYWTCETKPKMRSAQIALMNIRVKHSQCNITVLTPPFSQGCSETCSETWTKGVQTCDSSRCSSGPASPHRCRSELGAMQIINTGYRKYRLWHRCLFLCRGNSTKRLLAPKTTSERCCEQVTTALARRRPTSQPGWMYLRVILSFKLNIWSFEPWSISFEKRPDILAVVALGILSSENRQRDGLLMKIREKLIVS